MQNVTHVKTKPGDSSVKWINFDRQVGPDEFIKGVTFDPTLKLDLDVAKESKNR